VEKVEATNFQYGTVFTLQFSVKTVLSNFSKMKKVFSSNIATILLIIIGLILILISVAETNIELTIISSILILTGIIIIIVKIKKFSDKKIQ
jgi:membrane-bound ClpP family serine protease